MARYTAEIIWHRGEQNFLDNRYSRSHRIRFDGGVEIAGSPSPHVVPVPLSDPSAVDPEEAFIAALGSCHMLCFLFVAAKRRFVVDSYHDAAEGVLAKNGDGRIAVTRVTLRPAATFSGELVPTRAEIEAMHHAAHGDCFIANSVRTEVRCEAVFEGE